MTSGLTVRAMMQPNARADVKICLLHRSATVHSLLRFITDNPATLSVDRIRSGDQEITVREGTPSRAADADILKRSVTGLTAAQASSQGNNLGGSFSSPAPCVGKTELAKAAPTCSSGTRALISVST